MSETLRVRVKGGVLEPLEKLDLPEGKEVLVTIISVSPQGKREAFRRSFGTFTLIAGYQPGRSRSYERESPLDFENPPGASPATPSAIHQTRPVVIEGIDRGAARGGPA